MSDIVQRLRALDNFYYPAQAGISTRAYILGEAADEIERLRAALHSINARITRIPAGHTFTELAVRDIARAALKETRDE